MGYWDEVKNMLADLIHPEKEYRELLSDTDMLQKLAELLNKITAGN